MKVHFTIPYDTEKNLGKAYNETMALVPDGDAACLMDMDVLLALTPDAGCIVQKYAELYPNALLTCFTNRISELSRRQLLNQVVNPDPDIQKHIELAKLQHARLYNVTEINRDISGMLMVLPKSLWQKFPFDESGKCLGVDTKYGRALRAAGIKILRMDGLYVFHMYRMGMKNIYDKSHLQ
jgi:GT2 family glycosyltransferase